MKKIKNVAIIAHVDHGKTTIVDKLLLNSGLFRDNEKVDERMMDSNDLEKERGITILAKNTAIDFEDYHINILDTPGHADFGGEVERILKMVDGVLLVVDAAEGCMPQTRFVLKKAMEQHLRPIVIVNKVDKPNERCEEIVDEVMDLLIELGADEDLLEFPTVYCSAINNQAGEHWLEMKDDMNDICRAVVEHVPDAEHDIEAPLQMQVSLLEYDSYVGRIGIGRINQGKISTGETVSLCKNDGTSDTFRVSKLYTFKGLQKVETDVAYAGNIVAVVGKEDINVSETICTQGKLIPCEPLKIDEPTLEMEFIVNDSPFAGREGKFVTARKLEERLYLELETDVSLKVNPTDKASIFKVLGRGELHLAILIENMRREGFEFQVAKPKVTFKTINGVKCEPVEEVFIDVPDEHVGAVMQALGDRKADLIDMKVSDSGITRLQFIAYSRAIIGFTNEFMTLTKGYGIYNHSFLEYRPKLKAEIKTRFRGVLVSVEEGKAKPYSMIKLENRGTMIVDVNTDVYQGMVVGINNKLGDLDVNVSKAKEQTNVRSSNKDQTVVIKRPKILTLEEYIEFMDDDELLEVTPENIRLRKRYLTKNDRVKALREQKATL